MSLDRQLFFSFRKNRISSDLFFCVLVMFSPTLDGLHMFIYVCMIVCMCVLCLELPYQTLLIPPPYMQPYTHIVVELLNSREKTYTHNRARDTTSGKPLTLINSIFGHKIFWLFYHCALARRVRAMYVFVYVFLAACTEPKIHTHTWGTISCQTKRPYI